MKTVRVGRFQFQKKTKEEWLNSKVTLYDGELAIEADTSKIKIGDGRSEYRNLPYITIDNLRDEELKRFKDLIGLTAIANIQKETNQSISDLTEQTHEAIINIRSETNSAIADSKKYLDTQIAIIQERLTRLEDGLFNDITANPFTITFDNLNEINLIHGVYNASNKQLEC